ncbi:hypothetical protein B296_00003509 [Ensete ventricosum]|uniref:Uncharacterized protein n=1 Tax=Ensete ventricosum TaxID=4639 RepID=A0A426Z9G5_ENSVE|nr:hypothetical protein B296_00003509 [Ensete ventricosum]
MAATITLSPHNPLSFSPFPNYRKASEPYSPSNLFHFLLTMTGRFPLQCRSLILALKATSLLPFARVLKAGLGTDRLVLTRCLIQFSLGIFDTTVLAWDHRGVSEDTV